MRSLVVLQSFGRPRPTTNPYIIQLAESCAVLPDVTVRYWSWKGALFGGYDVIHLHWPESLFATRSRLKRFVRQLLYLLIVVRARLTRRALVRTVHNLELPTGISAFERALLVLTDRWTTLRITLNQTTPTEPDRPSRLIEHGHYRDWYGRHPRPAPVAGRFGYVGLIRRYKNVRALVEAFVGGPPPLSACTLHASGMPSSDDLADELTSAAGDDPRVTLDFHFLTEPELVAEISESELVVLPYREMHNSGTTLTALSLDRPVLVPANAANDALAAEVGSGWVFRYDGELSGTALVETLDEVRRQQRSARPELGLRDWDRAARLHRDAYLEARRLARGPRR